MNKTRYRFPKAIRILGLDPGYATIGFAIISQNKEGYLQLERLGVIRTEAHKSFSERLLEIHEDIQALCSKHAIDVTVMETLLFSKNKTTALKVAHARGVILHALSQKKIPVQEKNPTQMKAFLTGDGKASKQAIQKILMLELGLSSIPKPDDAADALSLALCYDPNYEII